MSDSIHEKYKQAIQLIDQINNEDPNTETDSGQIFPKEYLYSVRMSNQLEKFDPDASLALKIACRAQHICRWEIPRTNYPMDKKGYHQWRNTLKMYHAEKTDDILEKVGFDETLREEVAALIQKKNMRINPDAQALEDIICLVFLEHYFDDFIEKHQYEEEKIIDILQKTWKKMSPKGHQHALRLDLPDRAGVMVQKALAG